MMRKLIVLLLLASPAYGQVTVSGQGSISGVATLAAAVLGVNLSTSTLNFPSTVANTSSAPMAVNLLNSGGGPVAISGISTNSVFSQTNNCPATLAVNANCTINVTFTPTAAQVYAGTLSITTNAPGSPHTVALNGTGTSGGGGGGGALPSTVMSWIDIPNTKMLSVAPNYADINQGTCPTGPASVYGAWGGAAIDTTRFRLDIFGGGHCNYGGNESYALNLTANPITLTRLDEPTRFTSHAYPQASTDVYWDGKISSRHTYDYEEYVPAQDVLVVIGGSETGGGSFGRDVWERSGSTLAWTERISNGPFFIESVPPGAAYDPNSGLVFFLDVNNIYTYNPTTHVMTDVGGAYTQHGSYSTVTIDPLHKMLYLISTGPNIGNGATGTVDFMRFDISNPASVPSPTSLGVPAGCSAWLTGSGGSGIGADWYPLRQSIAFWNGGANIGLYNPTANSCTTVTPSGTAPLCTSGGGIGCAGGQMTHGTYGRWRYVRNLDQNGNLGGFIICTDPNQDCFFVRLDSQADTSFADRAAQPGVMNATGWEPTFTQANKLSHVSGFFGQGTPDTQDCTTFLSGSYATGTYKTCSVSFIWPQNTSSPGENCCQDYVSYFGDGAANQHFGNNSTFYVQFSYRLDTGATTRFMADTYPKFFIGYNEDGAGTCSAMSLAGNNRWALSIPTMFTNCSGNQLTSTDGLTYDGAGQYVQSGWPLGGYQCLYNGTNTSGPNCFKWLPNTWYTMYFKIHIGTFGTNSSTVEAWVAPYGQSLVKWISLTGVPITADGAGFDAWDLTYQATGHVGTPNSRAQVWYDNFIVSTQPIAAPFGPTP